MSSIHLRTIFRDNARAEVRSHAQLRRNQRPWAMSGIGELCSTQKKSSSNAGRSGGFKDYGDGGE